MTQTYTPPAPATSATFGSLRRGLLAVWAAFTLGAGLFVVFAGTNAPYADEWEFVPALLGDEPALPWLWQQHNEHRLPLPRAVFLGLFRLTHDFRAGMVLQVAMLSALALCLMHLANRLRGKSHWADAFFPISLLHVGHWENFVMGYQICFVLFAVLATGLGVVALRITRANAFHSGVAAGVLMLLLALTGGSGLVVVPPVAAWLVAVAVRVWRGGPFAAGVAGERPTRHVPHSGSIMKAVCLLLLAVLPLAYLGAYSVGYARPPRHPMPTTDSRAVVYVAGEVLAMSFGIGVSGVWWAVFAGLLALGLATVVELIRRRPEPAERLSVVGLLAVAAGVTGVAVAIGVGRGGWGTGMGVFSRYSMLTWPLLATTYLMWVKLGRKSVPIGLCVAAALAFPTNTGTGVLRGVKIKREYAGIAAQVQAGWSAEQIVTGEPFFDSHQGGQWERAARMIPLLRAAGVGVFAGK